MFIKKSLELISDDSCCVVSFVSKWMLAAEDMHAKR